MKVAFQGEHGAYSEEAALKYFGKDIETVPCESFSSVFKTIESGNADAGIVPIENSTAGTVAGSYEQFLNTGLRIIGETFVNIKHTLLAKPNAQLMHVKKAYSHPQALAQCKEFLERNKIEAIPFYDTAGSAKHISSQGSEDEAAIASELAGEMYGLQILEHNLSTFAHNTTRFFVISRMLEPTTKPTKISLIIKAAHKPGSLYKCLGVFANNDVNLTKLESKPIPEALFDYLFFIDCEGNLEDAHVKKALEELKEHTSLLKILGNYNTVK